MTSLITSYKFDKQCAANISLTRLFKILIGLIEVQRKASLYRAGCKNHKLQASGICGNIDNVVGLNSQNLNYLFFKGNNYPIVPYNQHTARDLDSLRNFRWDNNDIGNKRMKLLELMIKDLTNYLIKDAIK
jgi:hypothetical protein